MNSSATYLCYNTAMLFQLVTVFGGRRLSCCFSTVTTSLVSASAFKVFEVNLNKKGYQSFCNKWDLFSAILICIDSKFDSLKPTLTSPIKVNESQCIALFAVSGSIKKLFQPIVSIFLLFSINHFCQYSSFLNIFYFNRFCPMEKCGVTPHCLCYPTLLI